MRVLTKDGKPILVDGKMICVDEVTQISDVTINGESIVVDGVAEIQYASNNGSVAGVVRVLGTDPRTGIALTELDGRKNVLRTNPAGEARISARNTSTMPIVPTTLDYAVKCAMTDGKGAEWTPEEQLSARQRMGVEKPWVLKGTITTENKDVGANVDLSGCTELLIKGSGTGIANTPLGFGSSVLIETCLGNGSRNFYAEFKDSGVDTGIVPSVQGKYGSSASAVAMTGNLNCYMRSNIRISDITRINFTTMTSNVTDCNIEIYAR